MSFIKSSTDIKLKYEYFDAMVFFSIKSPEKLKPYRPNIVQVNCYVYIT